MAGASDAIKWVFGVEPVGGGESTLGAGDRYWCPAAVVTSATSVGRTPAAVNAMILMQCRWDPPEFSGD